MSSRYFTATTHDPSAVPEQSGRSPIHPVVVVGAGPVGMVAALELASLGVPSVILESRRRIADGSRAICVSARSLEILDRCGVLPEVLATALPWSGGRSYYRDRQVLQFTMPVATGRLPPMVNIQQCLLEQILLRRIEAEPLVQLRWQSKVTRLSQNDEHVVLQVDSPLGGHQVRAAWVVAADGPQSSLRSMLGLTLAGETHQGRYVIVDLHMVSHRPTERLCWFDPPTFPGKTVLLHKQPFDIWRLDYQIDDTEDLAAATDPTIVWAKVDAHLRWMGETGAWEPEWLSSYRAHSLTLDDYRSGRVLLSGDAAHLVPIFGVRGLNGGLADAHNLAWKLAAVLSGAPEGLLDSYSQEQRAAALQNIEAGSASARFMGPTARHAVVLRDAALSLALSQRQFRVLIDPRQTEPPVYPPSGCFTADDPDDGWVRGPQPGTLAPDVMVGPTWLEHLLVGGFVLVRFPSSRWPGSGSGDDDPRVTVVDVDEPLSRAAYDADSGGVYLLRPDRYVAARWRNPTGEQVTAALDRAHKGSMYGAGV